ncbi:hypothetical protein [Patulibacter americanus]|uniref:hypothetical protein n=1 Tax=Patulibacter americanus TaxID=588672 RepID=UPI0003B4410F|nr:hypothetical protein [Patulibacter americanus]
MSRSTDTPTDPWREELTPRSQASRRRWTVVLAALLLALGAAALDDRIHDALLRDGPGGRFVLYGLLLFIVFGLLRRGTRRLGRLRSSQLGALDERDTAARDRAFRPAFALFLVVVVVTLWSLDSILPHATRSAEGRALEGVVLGSDAVTTLVAWFVAWAVFLPTAVLAWREPDAPPVDEDEPRPVLCEPARDGLVAAALLAGAAVSAALPDDHGVLELVLAPLPFVVLALAVGVFRGRRHGRSWGRALAEEWPIAAVLLIVAALTAVMLGAGNVTPGDDQGTTVRDDEETVVTGEMRVRTVITQEDGRPDTERTCVTVYGEGGRELSGAAARRMVRTLGEHPSRLCG